MKIQRKYPFDRKDIKDSLEFYNYKCKGETRQEFIERNGGVVTLPTEEGIDKYEYILKANFYKLSRKEFIKMMLIYRKWYEMNGKLESVAIINKLIGDQKLFNRMMFTADGSYITERICFSMDGRVSIRTHGNATTFQKLINMMYSNYDFFVIHAKYISSIEEIKDDIAWNREMNRMCDAEMAYYD